MLVLNFVNQIVVGSLGATAIAAVGFSNSLTFILAVTLGLPRHLGEHPRGARPRRRSARRPRPHRHGSAARRRRASASSSRSCRGSSPTTSCRSSGPPPRSRRRGPTTSASPVLATLPVMLSAILSGVLRSAGRPTQPDDRDDGHRRRELGDRLLPRRRARPAAVARRRRRRLGHPRHGGRQGAHPAVDGLRPTRRRRLEPARQRAAVAGRHRAALRPGRSPSASPSSSGPSGRSSTTSSSSSSATRPSPRPRSSRPSRASSSSAASV